MILVTYKQIHKSAVTYTRVWHTTDLSTAVKERGVGKAERRAGEMTGRQSSMHTSHSENFPCCPQSWLSSHTRVRRRQTLLVSGSDKVKNEPRVSTLAGAESKTSRVRPNFSHI